MTGNQSSPFPKSKEGLLAFSQDTSDDSQDKLMLNVKLQLTKRERIVLELIMLSPIFIVLTVLHTTHSFVLTLFLFHVALTVFPLLFLKKKNINIDWKSLLRQDLSTNTRNLKRDTLIVAIPTIVFTIVYICYRRLFPDYTYERFRLPSKGDPIGAILLIIEFILLNPIVEELFWRFFADLFTGRGKKFVNKLDVCLHFGFYHWFVGYFISQDALLATCGCLGVTILGFILSLVKEKHGLITAMILHVGFDLAVGIVVADLQLNFIPFY